MIELRLARCESWFDERSARRLSARLGDRLWERCKGHRGLFVTLTYRREEYADARDLYRTAQEQQHVPLFLRKVERRLGVQLKGRWFCKLEFQSGGWVHWHLIILDLERIPHDLCTELWGHGHVWLRRLNRRNVRYCTKYTSKGGELPYWLLMEAPRSVKVVRVSHGFWGEPHDPPPDPDPCESSDRPRGMRLTAWVPLALSLINARDRFVARDGDGRYLRGHCDLSDLLARLMQSGHTIAGSRRGWVVVNADLDDVNAAAAAAAAVRAQARPPSALHLKRTGNPDEPMVRGMPEWVHRWYWARAMEGCDGA